MNELYTLTPGMEEVISLGLVGPCGPIETDPPIPGCYRLRI